MSYYLIKKIAKTALILGIGGVIGYQIGVYKATDPSYAIRRVDCEKKEQVMLYKRSMPDYYYPIKNNEGYLSLEKRLKKSECE